MTRQQAQRLAQAAIALPLYTSLQAWNLYVGACCRIVLAPEWWLNSRHGHGTRKDPE